jgi:hypothetical protein
MGFLSNLFSSKNKIDSNMLMKATHYANKIYNIPIEFLDEVLKDVSAKELNTALIPLLEDNPSISNKPLYEQYAFVFAKLYDRYLIKIGKKFDYFKQLTSIEIEEDREKGINYLTGRNNTSKDLVLAEKLLIRVGLQGDVRSQEILGDLYYKGDVLPKNLAKATEWYSLAANGFNSERARRCLDWMSSKNETIFSEDNEIIKDLS